MCLYKKIISKIDNNSYILYIPSKYDVRMKNFQSYELKEISNIYIYTSDIVLEYAYDNDNKEREDFYCITIHKDVNEFNLIDNYKSEININNTRSKIMKKLNVYLE